jgi:predicted AlkP superfamily phosphohydrolase/phosphomutase
MSNKVLIIGLDGADWRLLSPYLENGVMPNLAQLIESGVSGPLRSTLPANSSVAWNTFMTGRNPGKHAVYDFTQRSPDNPALMVGVNSRSRRCETFFDVMGRYGQKVGAINIPITYPPFPVNGFMLGGMFVQEGQPYTYPENLATELDQQIGGFPVNGIRWRFMLNKMEELVDEAIAVTEQRARVLDYLIVHKEWDVLVQVFVTPDRLQHPLMHVFDPEHPCYDKLLAQQLSPKLRTIHKVMDDMLGRAWQKMGGDTTLMVISDHGFRSVHKAIYIREILSREGLLSVMQTRDRNGSSPKQLVKKLLRPFLPTAARQALSKRVSGNGAVGSPQEMANLIWAQTQAYVTTTTSQGVFINVQGRDLRGIVSPGAEYEQLLNDIEALLLAERDPANGQPVIASVVRGREFYKGPWVEHAPDLLFEPAHGYSLAKGAKGHLQPFSWFMGDHDPDGIFVAVGPGMKQGTKIESAELMDIAPTTLYLVGTPIPDDMDGRVLNLFVDQRLELMPPAYEKTSAAPYNSDYAYTPDEERQVEEQLRSLGYM